MRVLIVTAGSRGDVTPYTGLGARLRAAGHRVTLAAPAAFAPLAAGCGLDFRAIPGDLSALRASDSDQRPSRSPPGAAGVLEFLRLGNRFVDDLGDGIAAAAEPGADVLLLSSTTAPLGYSVAQAHGVPSLGVFLQPLYPTGAFPPTLLNVPSLGRWGNRTAGRLGHALARRVYADASRRLRARLGLPPAGLGGLDRRAATEGWPVKHGFSPAVVPRPADWRPGLDVVGYWWPAGSDDWRPPAELLDFLAAGPPPVYVGFGSMGHASDQLDALVTGSLRRAGVRGIVQADAVGPGPGRPVSADVLAIGEAPHDWLFPRMAALVHHAGCGTTAAGLRAGVPAVPVPMLADQPFWAGRLAALGTGPDAVPFRRLTEEGLATAIRAAVTEPAFARRARAVADRLADEDGAGAVVAALDRLAG
ncbi:glycosyltransferase [Plantactinospora sp. CA-290183]|uniref:glycosyltransferase n=1 Tax=Plantactinospora sp. CA-290183 TaxID=3240006 RepID=UPI003D8B5281